MMDEYTRTEIAYKNGYEAGKNQMAAEVIHQLTLAQAEANGVVRAVLTNVMEMVQELAKANRMDIPMRTMKALEMMGKKAHGVDCDG